MRKIIFCLMVVSTIFASCKKETKDVSKVYDANASKIVLIGDAIYAPPAGTTTYNDPGATFTDDDGSTRVLAPLNQIDLSQPGFYSVAFEATSIHGYVREMTRLVLVTGVSASIDFSGNYKRSTNSVPVKITKLGPGLYKTDNVGGLASGPTVGADVFFGQINDTLLAVPSQAASFGTVSCKNATVKLVSGKYQISWIVLNKDYFLDNQRTFIQQ